MLQQRRIVANCAMAGAVGFPIATVLSVWGLGALLSGSGWPEPYPVLLGVVTWGLVAGGMLGVGLGIDDPLRSMAMAGQGVVGGLAVWALASAVPQESGVLAVPGAGAIAGLALGARYAGGAAATALAGAVGVTVGMFVLWPLDHIESQPWAVMLYVAGLALPGVTLGTTVGACEARRRADQSWVDWRAQDPVRVVTRLLAGLGLAQFVALFARLS